MAEAVAGVDRLNDAMYQRAAALLYQKMQNALITAKNQKVTMVTIRVPMHGDRFGEPKGAVETEG